MLYSSSAAVPRQGLHGQVVRHLGLRILRGEWQPGETLPTESALGAELRVSRTVLREAIKVLAAKGLLEPRPRTGTRVLARSRWRHLDPDLLSWRSHAPPDERFLRNLCGVRLIVEPAVARLAAARATPGDVAALETWLRGMELALHDTEAYVAADTGFHAAILGLCQNELLIQMSDTIKTALRTSRAVTAQVAGAAEESLPLHRAVAEAIRRHDQEAAEAAMRVLVERTAADIGRAFERART